MTLTLKKATKKYNGQTVLYEIDFSASEGDKIVIIGENGSGKSTLLRMLTADEELASGKRFVESHADIAFVSQELSQEVLEQGQTGEEYVYGFGDDKLMRRVKKLISDFDLGEYALSLPLGSLSGGQQKILALSVAFARNPDFILLDEPENHIDIFARQVLIELMKEFRGGLVFVSHDQDLINAVTNRIVEVENEGLTAYKGNYEFYLEERARQKAGQEHTWQVHQKKVEQLDKLIKRMRQWVQVNPDLGAQLRARKSQLRQLQDKAPEKPKKSKRIAISTSEVEQNRGKRILKVESLSVTRGDRRLLMDTSLSLFFGQKVAMIGRNGSGKTSFLKAILGDVAVSGILKVGNNVKVGYFSQESLETLDENSSAVELLQKVTRAPESNTRSLLARYLIDANHCMRPIKTLSGGQKMRLRFCLLFASKPDLLLLDEPTNHLDPVTWDLLVQALNEYQGTMVLVSHDRVFIDQVAKELWIIENGSISQFAGTLTNYLEEGGE